MSDELYLIEREDYRGGTEISVGHRRAFDSRAILATDIVKHFGVVACVPDGEDSNGRQRMRLQTPDELVTRVCEIVDRMATAFTDRGWVLALPDVKQPVPREKKQLTE